MTKNEAMYSLIKRTDSRLGFAILRLKCLTKNMDSYDSK